jgi:N-acetylmuramoyl-L-alanine amidase
MDIKYIVVHRTESKFGDIKLVDKWHRERGFDMCGYHWLIDNCFPTAASWRDRKPVFKNDGKIEIGRVFGTRGAHCKGFNNESVGIALVGMRDFTSKQYTSLAHLIRRVKDAYPDAEVVGHYELNPEKPNCPSINMDYLRGLLG